MKRRRTNKEPGGTSKIALGRNPGKELRASRLSAPPEKKFLFI